MRAPSKRQLEVIGQIAMHTVCGAAAYATIIFALCLAGMSLEAAVGFVMTTSSILVKVLGQPDQIHKIFHEKAAGSLSPGNIVLGLVSYFSWTIYGYIKHDWLIVASQGAGVIGSYVIWCMVTYYTAYEPPPLQALDIKTSADTDVITFNTPGGDAVPITLRNVPWRLSRAPGHQNYAIIVDSTVDNPLIPTLYDEDGVPHVIDLDDIH